MAYGEAEDAGGLVPAKDNNETMRHFIRRTLPIFECVDYISGHKVNAEEKGSFSSALLYHIRSFDPQFLRCRRFDSDKFQTIRAS